LVSKVVFDYLIRDDVRNKILLDGFPRTIEQAKALDQFSRTKDIKIHAIFFFDVKAELLVERLSARRQCGQCKAVYNLKTMAPKAEGKCDSCGGTLIQRKDDTPQVVKDRLEVYNRQTLPILDHYKGRSEYKCINAAQDVEKVFDDIMAVLSPAHKPSRVC
jgi:adenylate kinase